MSRALAGDPPVVLRKGRAPKQDLITSAAAVISSVPTLYSPKIHSAHEHTRDARICKAVRVQREAVW